MSAERGEVPFGRQTLHYGVQRSARRRTVSITVTAAGVTVKAPAEVSPERLAELVRGRGAWVVDKQLRFRTLLEGAPWVRSFKDGSAVLYLGRQCRLWRVRGLKEPRLRGRRLEVPPLNDEALQESLEAWYRKQAERILKQRVARYARRLGTWPQAVLVRDQRARWGSCNRKGELRFNWRIVMAPMSLVDYVAAHELCHLEQMHHGPAFWSRLAELLPDYQGRQERLAVEGVKYTL